VTVGVRVPVGVSDGVSVTEGVSVGVAVPVGGWDGKTASVGRSTTSGGPGEAQAASASANNVKRSKRFIRTIIAQVGWDFGGTNGRCLGDCER